MKPPARLFLCLLVLALCTSVIVPAASFAQALPAVSGDITADTTWTLAGSPYNVGNITVHPGATLTIEPGVVVRFASNTALTVLGTIMAHGTPDAPIRLGGTSAEAGSWRGISVTGSAAAPLDGSLLAHVLIEDGGLPFGVGANLFVEYAHITVRDSTIRHGLNAGMYASVGGVSDIADTTIENNQGTAIIFADGGVNPVLERIHASGNGSDTISLGGGALTGQHVWENAGLPYRALPGNTLLSVEPGASLMIEPGVTVLFDANARFQVRGLLRAEGTPEAPITLTGVTKQPGSWQGMLVFGGTAGRAAASMRYVTVEYGGLPVGTGANIYVEHGQLNLAHSSVRNSGMHGIYLGLDGANSLIETTQIVSNAGYGIVNSQPERPALAVNNWWGAANGPHADSGCASGTGANVSSGVAVVPFLPAAAAAPIPPPAASLRLLTLQPQRWFAPADGRATIAVELHLRDGAGAPLAGRMVRLHTSHGNVTDGGITDLQGRTFAYLTAASAGEATVDALIDQATSCEFARSASATVQFTDAATNPLSPETPAPYVSGHIHVTPLPLVRGVPATLTASVANPGTTPLVIAGSFSYAQQGIGLTFGPLASPAPQTIPAGATRSFSIPFTPPIEGHYCFRFTYEVVAATRGAATAGASGPVVIQDNYDIIGPPKLPLRNYDDVRREQQEAANQSLNLFDQLASFFRDVHDVGERYNNENQLRQYQPKNSGNQTRAVTQASAGSYRALVILHTPTVPPVQPGPGISAARAAALSATRTALANLAATFDAAATAGGRYHAATEAHDLAWAALQASALDFYSAASARAFASAADQLDAYRLVVQAEGVAQAPVGLNDIRAFQERIRSQGFSATELDDMHLLGMDAAAIAAYHDAILSAAPERLVGDQVARVATIASAYRALSRDLLANPLVAAPTASLTRTAAAAPASSRLASAGPITRTLVIGNPFATPTTIAMRVRDLGLPPDWIVTVSPVALTLAPGVQQQVMVTIIPGTAVQGSDTQVAVEGYAGSTLIDGVAFTIAVPQRSFFDGHYRVSVPLMQR